MDFPRIAADELEDHVIFQITDWYIPEADKNMEKYDAETDDEPDSYNIIIYGTTCRGSTVSVRIKGYEPYFYVKPPADWEGDSNEVFKDKLQKLKFTLMKSSYQCYSNRDGIERQYERKIINKPYRSHLLDVKMVKKKEFWGFTKNRDFRFIKIIVKSLNAYNQLKYYFQSLKKKGFQLYESNIDPFLRYIHERNIKPCGWVQASDYEEESIDKFMTRCDYNLVTKHCNIRPIDKNTIAPLLIASFDIECTSSHGDFPVAKKDYRKVAQDLANVAKAGYEITEELLSYWLQTIYIKDIVIEDNLIINKVYAKSSQVNQQQIKESVKESSKDIIKILDEISNTHTHDQDTDDEIDEIKPITLKEQNILENKLNVLLKSFLPALEGDKIIQIGTTVHRYGSDEIIYKHIVTLNTCDAVENVDLICCDTERKLILEWKQLLNNLNPDILIGYNIFGFDMEYIWTRAQENHIIDEFGMGLGRNLQRRCKELGFKKLASSALGENILKYFEMDGTVVIDLFKVMQREHKLDSYKLDNVAQIFLGDHKDDLKPHEIFQKFAGSSTDRSVIAKYCIQDCALVNRLMHKLKILENNIGMGNVCLVPLNYLFMRGQGIKIFSLIAKECMDRSHLIPVLRSYNDIEIEDDGYEGAVVLEPKEGIYINDPIVVFDYGSLYPSSMIARNLSHDCYVLDDKYYDIDDPEIDYIKVTYDIYEGVGDKKKNTGKKECIFAKYKDGRKGIIADILCMLLQQRKNTRKKMEYQTVILKDGSEYSGIYSESKGELLNIDTNEIIKLNLSDIVDLKDTYNKFEQDVFDALQLAYKITANSLYGQIGARTSPIYLKDIAACTTATGREMIMLAKDFVEKNYQAEVIYGDSVMPYTPITYKTGNQIILTTFADVDGLWRPYDNFKSYDKDRTHKEQFMPNDTHVWTHKGWAKIVRIIRHKTVKKIYRIVTSDSIVDVTEDHSLLDANANIVKPGACRVGQTLLHSRPELHTCSRCNFSCLDHNQAYIYGLFVASGKCHVYYSEYGTKYIWEIVSDVLHILQKAKIHLEKLEPNMIFNIVNRNNQYVLVCDPDTMFVDKYKINCYHNNSKFKIVPSKILNGTKEIMRSFKEGLDDISSHYSLEMHKQITIQSYVILLQILGYNVKLDVKSDMANIIYKQSIIISESKICDIQVLHEKYDGYVYDIETEQGVFHGGVGNLILKNTDSIFCKFPLKDSGGNAVQGKDALKYAIEVGKHVEKNIVKIMPVPQKLNYEKSLYPFILFSKKRYVGNLYETDVNKFKQKSMGIVLKRRDNAPIVKKIYGGIIDILLNKQDINESIDFLRFELTDLVDGKAPINDLIISKTLRATYKDATKIPHKVLADRMAARDPGNRPQVNDRIPFVYIKVPDAKLQGDRIESPEYIVENRLIPDYLHYITNQIMNPILQLYALCLDELPNYDKTDEYWKELDLQLQEKPLYKDDAKRKNRMNNLKLQMVKELLFDEFIYMLTELPKSKLKKKTKMGVAAVTNEVIQLPANGCNVNAEIKVVKRKESGLIESSAKILHDKKVIWTYENKNAKDKNHEIITIIGEMIGAVDETHILCIKISGHKSFAIDFNKALMCYREFEKCSENVDLIENAMKDIDISMIKFKRDIMVYESILLKKHRFQLRT
jgi:DNA polymerase elongation subunit (family B)